MPARNLRQNLARYLMHRELRAMKRSGETVVYSRAMRIGILYDATQEKDYELIRDYVKAIRAQSKEVLALGYFDSRELPNNRFMKLGLDFFTRKSLNWKYKPGNPIVQNFMQSGFDILICFNLNNSIPLQYISALTRARFKIGRYTERAPHIFDFEIKMDGPITLRQLIEQVNHYLNLIRNDQYQEA